MLGLAEKSPFLAGVVGWVDLLPQRSPCEEQLLEEFAEPSEVRRRPPRHPGTSFQTTTSIVLRRRAARPAACSKSIGVPFDPALLRASSICTTSRRLAQAPSPTLPMVIDHLAKPRIKERTALDDWLPHFKTAAAFPNIFCKLSGMITEADWRELDRGGPGSPMSKPRLEHFGPERLMFGSDWSGSASLAATYGEVRENGRRPRANLDIGTAGDLRRDGRTVLRDRVLTTA